MPKVGLSASTVPSTVLSAVLSAVLIAVACGGCAGSKGRNVAESTVDSGNPVVTSTRSASPSGSTAATTPGGHRSSSAHGPGTGSSGPSGNPGGSSTRATGGSGGPSGSGPGGGGSSGGPTGNPRSSSAGPTGHPGRSSSVPPPPPRGNPGCPGPAPVLRNGKWSQAISFPALGVHEYPRTQVTLAACARSGLPVSYALSGPNNSCTLNGAVLDVDAVPASCTVVASQPGDAQWAAAASVSHPYSADPQSVDGSWVGPNPSVAVSRAGGSFTVTIKLTSIAGFTVDQVSVDPDNSDGICGSSDPQQVHANGTTTVNLDVPLSGNGLTKTGTCTLRINLTGSANTQVNHSGAEQSFTIVD
ncbi:hypothetical protein M6D93_05525 [Jatrophihabitans telluris]|uniref:DUF4232 domain-containing protein n=1 Tax=Jatrophihabitans telluris TaxID=2038343 RepID=A0ABY4R2F5_9ACTN|nr:hypothetical protein [Jatrophihabitans telluris]UQX89466.1 hypothetical protein M6D93_05525 [Jatrophihabitans telluris]